MTSLPVSLAASLRAKHAVLIVLAASILSSTPESQSASSFNLCVHPYRPTCIEDVTGGEACEQQVKAFVAAMAVYRSCLFKEAQRSIEEINDILDQTQGNKANFHLKGTKR